MSRAAREDKRAAPPGPGIERFRHELAIAAVWGLVIFAITLVPYVVGYMTAPSGKVFGGFFFLGDDGNTYIAKMREGMNGAWNWSDPYNSNPVASPVLLFLFYLIWGKVAGALHLSLFLVFHVARLTGAIVLVLGARRLAAATLPPGRTRLIAVILGLVGSGAGYLLILLGLALGRGELLGQPVAALDLHIPEVSSFFSIMTFPHFTWAAGLMALAVVELLVVASADRSRETWRPALIAAALTFGLCLIHPQMLAVLALAAVAALISFRARPSRWVLMGLPFLPSLPLLAYYSTLLANDPVISAWTRQWHQEAFAVFPTLFAFGLPLALGVLALTRSEVRRQPAVVVVAAWVSAVLILLYLPSPVSIQRRLFDGVALPIGILAALGIDSLARGLRTDRARERAAAFLVAACSLTSVLIAVIPFTLVSARQPDIYLDRSEVEAMSWLSGEVDGGTPPAALSTFDTGLYVPARAGARVYAGHYSETIDSGAKRRVAADTIRSGGSELADLMRQQGVTYLLIGPRERASGVGPVPSALTQVYSRDGFEVYRLSG